MLFLSISKFKTSLGKKVRGAKMAAPNALIFIMQRQLSLGSSLFISFMAGCISLLKGSTMSTAPAAVPKDWSFQPPPLFPFVSITAATKAMKATEQISLSLPLLMRD
jgi:hypothetical protein